MLPPVGIEPRTSNFNAVHATVWANSLFAGSLKPLNPYIVLLYWFLHLQNFLESIKHFAAGFSLFSPDCVESTECIFI